MIDKTALRGYGPALEAERWQCPVARLTSLFADRWSAPILFALEPVGPSGLRSEQLRRGLHPVSRKVLVETIRRLERNGFVERIVAGTVPPQVTYRLSPLGIDLVDVLRGLVAWHASVEGDVEAARRRFDEAGL